MQQITTKMEKVKKITHTCDICDKKIDYLNSCDVCGKDLCSDHASHHAGDTLLVGGAGNYTCCHDCDKKLQPWRNKLDDLKSEYNSKRSKIIKEFKKEFGLK